MTLHRASTSRASPRAASLTVGEKARLLGATALFEGIAADVLTSLAARCATLDLPVGACLTVEGERGDSVLVIVSGRAEVTQADRRGVLVLDTLGPGSVVGEIAVLAPERRRSATVTAREPVLALSLRGDDVREIARELPQVGARLAHRVDATLRSNILARNVLTAGLSAPDRRRLAEKVECRSVAAGMVLMRQGDPGDVCFCIAAGRAEVLRSGVDGGGTLLDTVGPGSVVGEAALATKAPRTATVRMLEDGSVLVLPREALVAAIDSSTDVQSRLLRLLQARARPRRRAGVTLHERTNADGEVVTIIRDQHRGAYYRLSAAGRLVWEQLDGEHSLNQLTLAHFRRFGTFAPDVVGAIVLGLIGAGFAESDTLADDVAPQRAAIPRSARILHAALRALTWQTGLTGVDPWLATLHRRGGRLLFTVPALVMLAMAAVGGMLAAALTGPSSFQALADAEITPGVLVALLPIYGLSVAVHELAHALTVKNSGRHVYRMGVGWHFVGPVAYVDTSEMWLADKRAQLAVTLAGPASNLVLGGLGALGGVVVHDPTGSVVLGLLATTNYLLAFANLNPLLEFDGYYVLIDVVERPNLRAESLAWIGSAMRRDLRGRHPLRSHRLELAYGVASLLYIGAVAALAIIVYRVLLQDVLARAASPGIATTLSWGAAVISVAALLAAVAAQLDGDRLADGRSPT